MATIKFKNSRTGTITDVNERFLQAFRNSSIWKEVSEPKKVTKKSEPIQEEDE